MGMPESSLHLGHFERIGELWIQVLQQHRPVPGKLINTVYYYN